MNGKAGRGDAHREGRWADLVAGFCRFSYLGKSDWSALRLRQPDEAEFQDRARLLFDDARLAARFAAFERICLPSILAQDDPRFVMVVITSPELPPRWMARLRDLCAQSETLHLEVVADRDLNRGLGPLLQDMTAMAGRQAVQRATIILFSPMTMPTWPGLPGALLGPEEKKTRSPGCSVPSLTLMPNGHWSKVTRGMSRPTCL